MKVFALLMALLNALLTVFGMGGGIKNRYDTYLNVAYGDSPTALMDVYIPASAKGRENNGVLVFLHGGHWKSGTKSDMESDCTRYVEKGYVSVTMNYSLCKFINNVSLRDMLNDVDAALRTIRSFCAQKGVSVTQSALVGYSAGAHLALTYAYSRPDGPLPVRFVVSRSGPADMDPALWVPLYGETQTYSLLSDLCGQEIRPDNLESPAVRQAIADVSPVHYVNADTVPTLLCYGKADNIIPLESVDRLERALSDAGVVYDRLDFFCGHVLSDVGKTREMHDETLSFCKTFF
ncbi:MAG: alpha/beta hydrolase [Clostridia bacterium]|nr:alpha/beta hydrolase [Clostridia bacterium]